MKKSLFFVLFTLFFINITSIFVRRDGGSFDMFSYAVRIGLFLFVLGHIVFQKIPIKVKSLFFYKINWLALILLTSSLIYSFFNFNYDLYISISTIFPLFFLLANNIYFMQLGYKFSTAKSNQFHFTRYFRYFAIASILGMTFITLYVIHTYGGLISLWEEARKDTETYSIFLNVYKNANPYKFAALIPFLFLVKRKINILLILVCIINIIIAGKRGPLLGITFAGLVVFLLDSFNYKLKHIRSILLGLFVFLFYVSYIDDSIFQTILYRMDPTQHYNASSDMTFYMSSRDEIWSFVLLDFWDSDLWLQLFGHGVLGAYSLLTENDGPGNAHNTWIELLYNCGYLGIIVLIMYYIGVIRACYHMLKKNYEWKGISQFLVAFSLISTFYTVTFYGGFMAQGYVFCFFSFLYAFFKGRSKSNSNQMKLE